MEFNEFTANNIEVGAIFNWLTLPDEVVVLMVIFNGVVGVSLSVRYVLMRLMVVHLWSIRWGIGF